jgi:hypothetical protein
MPWYAWAVCILFASIAAVTLFFGLSVGLSLGLSAGESIIATAVVELTAATGIGAVVLYYQDPDEEPNEWKYYP